MYHYTQPQNCPPAGDSRPRARPAGSGVRGRTSGGGVITYIRFTFVIHAMFRLELLASWETRGKLTKVAAPVYYTRRGYVGLAGFAAAERYSVLSLCAIAVLKLGSRGSSAIRYIGVRQSRPGSRLVRSPSQITFSRGRLARKRTANIAENTAS